MGMHRRFTFLLLLLSLHASGSFIRATALLDLPRVVTLSEDAMPGTHVAKVTVSCRNASGSPNVTLYGIEPGHPFNPIAISADPMDATAFQAEVTLRAGAELDAHRVNQYLLTLWATCPGEEEVQERLFVRVTRGQVLRCDEPFASAEGDVVQVPADVAPQTPLYAVLPQPLAGLMFRLRTRETPLTLTRRGLVLAPANGFNPSQDIQTFRLEIEVMDRHGHNCSGVVRVEVLPSHRPRVTFREPQWSVTVTKSISPLEVVTQVRASGDNVRYAILAPAVPVLFTINEVTGEILSTHQLQVAHTQLLVQAYNALHPNDHDTATVNITVQGTDQQAPSCVPAIFVSQQPETVSPGSTLVTLRCTDFSGTERQLQYDLEGPPASRSSFHMEGPRLKVNTTLDYDSEDMAAVGFQLTATIVVTAGGQPPQSTRVPVFLTLTPVNEFTPVCPSGATFTVLEMAAFGTTVGRVTGTDRDYPQNSLEYSLEGGPGSAQPFSIDTQTGEIRVVGSLDSQRHRSYRLSVRLTDTQNDVDPAKRRSCLCDVTVHLQAVPDQAPVCTPEVQELWIVAGPGSRQPVTHLVCQGDTALTYAIAGGNKDGRFRLEGNTIFYLPNGLSEPCTYVLLVKAWSSSGAPHHSTLVTLVVHVTPWSTPVPPSTTTQHTVLQKEPLVITRTVAVWHPPPWFVAVLTVSSALLLVTLGCMAWRLPCRNPSPGKLLLDKSSWDAEEQRGDKEKQGHPHASSPGQFDGRAQDPSTGRDYLFNSKTGAWRWI